MDAGRTPEGAIDWEYISAVGLAVYCFARLEWHAAWCCERIEPGIIEGPEDRTAGRVADTFVALVDKLERLDGRAELQRAAVDFRNLVATRNNPVHAKPGRASDGWQGLFGHGDHWTIAELEGAADVFTNAACAYTNHWKKFLICPAQVVDPKYFLFLEPQRG